MLSITEERRERRCEQHEQIEDESLLVTVQENGLSFIVDLTKRIDTGLFLDQMISRKSLMDNCEDLDILNLFSYTGSFSVYAAKGGAKTVTSVDLSATYCEWCEKNLNLNGFTVENYRIINTDALSFIAAEKEAGKRLRYHHIRSAQFSNSRKWKMILMFNGDYLSIITSLHTLLVPKGVVLFSTNLSNFKLDKRKIYGYQVREVTKENAAPGFSTKKNSLRSWILEKIKDEAVLEQEQQVKEVVLEEQHEVMVEEQKEEVLEEQHEEAVVEQLEEVVEDQKDEEEISPMLDIANSNELDLEIDLFIEDELDSDDDDDNDTDVESTDDDGKNTRQRRYERRHPGEVAAERKQDDSEIIEKLKPNPFDSLDWNPNDAKESKDLLGTMNQMMIQEILAHLTVIEDLTIEIQEILDLTIVIEDLLIEIQEVQDLTIETEDPLIEIQEILDLTIVIEDLLTETQEVQDLTIERENHTIGIQELLDHSIETENHTIGIQEILAHLIVIENLLIGIQELQDHLIVTENLTIGIQEPQDHLIVTENLTIEIQELQDHLIVIENLMTEIQEISFI